MWFVATHGFVIIVAIFFLLPETLTSKSEPAITQELMRMSTRDSTKVKSKEFTTALKHYLIEPLSVLLLLRFPPVFLTVLIAAIAFSSVYVLNIVIESGFAQPRTNFKQTTIGLTYMSTGMGYIVSSMVGGHWMDSIIAREARKTERYDAQGNLIYLPEDRMKRMPGSPIPYIRFHCCGLDGQCIIGSSTWHLSARFSSLGFHLCFIHFVSPATLSSLCRSRCAFIAI